MKIGFHCPAVPGHLNPLTTLAAELQSRRHEIVFFGSRDAQAIVQRAGLSYYELGAGDPLVESQEEEFSRLGRSTGFQSMMLTGKIFGYQSKVLLKFLPAALQECQLDGMVIDQVDPTSCILAERHDIPYAVACNALAMYWDPLAPPPPLPWSYRDDLYGRIRNRLAKSILLPVYCWMADMRTTKVDPLMLVTQHQHGLVHVAQQPSFFDFPREKLVPHLHFTGPWHRPQRDDNSIEFPWDWLDDRPLIYASMGTLQNKLSAIFASIIEVARDLPYQVVLSKGGGEVPVEGTLPDNILLVDRAPQLRLLERASAAITHAGLNTALECLAHGVPMLCLPVTNDQPGVAKRVEWLGAGRVIPVQRANADKIRRNLLPILEEHSYRERARQCRDQIAQTQGLALAADLILQALKSGQPVLREVG